VFICVYPWLILPFWIFEIRRSRIIRMISVTINGESRQFDAPLDCAELLAKLELVGKRVAVERNGEIVPRSRHAAERLADGDRLEIVVAVGGG
jgi:sulfur carrier protein